MIYSINHYLLYIHLTFIVKQPKLKMKKKKKKKKKNNQPHCKLWLVEYKNCHREFVFHLSNMHPTRLHEENDKKWSFKIYSTLQKY